MYVLPVSAVIILCLLVYAFGFKSTSPVPPSLNSIIPKDSKKSASKKGNKSNEKNGNNRAAGKSTNGPVTGAKVKVKSDAGKQEQRTKKQKPLPQSVPVPETPADEDQEDAGDWVQVQTKKKPQKQKQESVNVVTLAVEPAVPDKVVVDEVVVDKNVQDVPAVEAVQERKLEVENWEIDDPIEEKEYKASDARGKKKTSRRGKEAKELHAEVAPQPSSRVAPVENGDIGKVVKDKLTSEILATYDSVPTTDKTAAAASKKKKEKKKAKAESNFVGGNPQQVKDIPQAVAPVVLDKSSPPAADGGHPNQEFGGVAVVEQEVGLVAKQTAQPSLSSEATDVTDGKE